MTLAPVPELLTSQLGLSENSGVVVAGVVTGSAAEKAGLRKFDVIIRFAGGEVHGDPRRFQEQVRSQPAGKKVELTVLRGGKKESLTANLTAERPIEPGRGERGPERDRD